MPCERRSPSPVFFCINTKNKYQNHDQERQTLWHGTKLREEILKLVFDPTGWDRIREGNYKIRKHDNRRVRDKVKKMYPIAISLMEYGPQCQIFPMVISDSFKLLEQNLVTIVYIFLLCFHYFCIYCFVISSSTFFLFFFFFLISVLWTLVMVLDSLLYTYYFKSLNYFLGNLIFMEL